MHDADTPAPGDGAVRSGERRAISLLPPGFHPGGIFGFSPLVNENRDAARQNYQALLEAGVRVGRAQLSWRDLEPTPGTFDEEPLNEALEGLLEDGLFVALTVETIDSSSYEIPEDLVAGELELADGRAFDDALILGRFEALLQWLVPRLAATRSPNSGVFALIVGNEPDNTIEDFPQMAPHVAAFTAHARQTVHRLDSELSVSMTVTSGALVPDSPLQPTVAASDFLSINYYCQRLDNTVRSPEDIEADLARMAELADGREILVQELGCSSGYPGGDGTLTGSDEIQRQFLENVLTRMRRQPSVFRAAFWFTLMDFSPEVARSQARPLCDEGLFELCGLLEEVNATYGLWRWSDGSPRPAFHALLSDLRSHL